MAYIAPWTSTLSTKVLKATAKESKTRLLLLTKHKTINPNSHFHLHLENGHRLSMLPLLESQLHEGRSLISFAHNHMTNTHSRSGT